jgi:hypothetical protein
MSEKLNTRKYEGHTEGPWTIFVDDDGLGGDYPRLLQIEGPTHTIAYDIDRPSGSSGGSNEANNATANLIADAPLILDAYNKKCKEVERLREIVNSIRKVIE